MTTLVKAPPKLADQTCLQGYVITTYEQLVKTFGLPHIVETEDRYAKVRAEWVLKPLGTAMPITIYDWKEVIPVEEVTEWHIGGDSPLAVQLIKEVFPSAYTSR